MLPGWLEGDLANALQMVRPVVLAALIIAATYVVAKLVSRLTDAALFAFTPAMRFAAKRTLSAVILVIGGILAAEQLGLSIEVLLVLLAVMGIAVVLALHNVLSSVAARYFIEPYVPIRVGDTVTIGSYRGKVIEINPLTTLLQTDDGRVVSVPNSVILREPVVNESASAAREISIPIALPSKDVKLPELESALIKACMKLRSKLDPMRPPQVEVRSRSEREVQMLLKVWVSDPSYRSAVTEELKRRVDDLLTSMRGQG
ncbi:MAG: mechanosensitive ion channel [Nitrososphaerota archaeon]